jgi:hypothetical protein
MIEECPTCCMAWIVRGITGEVIRLYGSYENRLIKERLLHEENAKR